jgi:hypothetical protein
MHRFWTGLCTDFWTDSILNRLILGITSRESWDIGIPYPKKFWDKIGWFIEGLGYKFSMDNDSHVGGPYGICNIGIGNHHIWGVMVLGGVIQTEARPGSVPTEEYDMWRIQRRGTMHCAWQRRGIAAFIWNRRCGHGTAVSLPNSVVYCWTKCRGGMNVAPFYM